MTEQENIEYLKSVKLELSYYRYFISELSSDYRIKASKIALEKGLKDSSYIKLNSLATKLTLTCESIDSTMEDRRKMRIEKANYNAKFYELHKKIDLLNEENKQLRKLNENLKKNINL